MAEAEAEAYCVLEVLLAQAAQAGEAQEATMVMEQQVQLTPEVAAVGSELIPQEQTLEVMVVRA